MSEMKKSALSTERLGFSFESNNVVLLNAKKPTRLFGARKKRQSSIASMLSDIIRTLSGDEVSFNLNVNHILIINI